MVFKVVFNTLVFGENTVLSFLVRLNQHSTEEKAQFENKKINIKIIIKIYFDDDG